jgi:hypothetical protein
MDCWTFRNQKLATPHEASAPVLDHERACAGCAAFAHAVDAFERRLQRAAQVSVPDGLAEQIILRHRPPRTAGRSALRRFIDALQSRNDGRSVWFGPGLAAIAAALVFALAALLIFDGAGYGHDLADRVIAHVASEPEMLQVQEEISPEQLPAAFARYGARMQGSIGEVRHLGYCLVEGLLAQHVVVDTPHGPVTLILVPGEVVSSRPRTKEGFTAVVVPLRGGSLGIVTQSPERIRDVEQFVTSRVHVVG